jgi:RimJ/RimL family protein N-acetyltransferase|tara:strand:- start:103 stop:513 length:411 start_codon:yes stop_codon:yes gene_type:complete
MYDLKFRLINKSDLKFLFNHLKERDPRENISHKKMPTYDEHVKFVLSKPYSKWYIIFEKNKKIGSVYLTKADEIGLHLKKEYFRESMLKEILECLMKNEQNKRFVFNVSPRNKKFMKFLQKNGYVISQQTVVKYFE